MDDRGDGEADAAWEARRVELAPAELDLIVKACLKYRRSLPIYLRCAQPELELIEGILKKIT